MKKKWLVKNKIDRDFIKQFPQYSEVTLQLLLNRNLIEPQEIKDFLTANYKENHHDPFLFNQMEPAVDLIIKHIKNVAKILVYGDYDADGVTSVSVLLEILSTLKAVTSVYLPDRVTEGYGLNMAAIKEMASNGIKLIITVDNGIRNKAEVAYAQELGVEIIITDHHVAPPELSDLPNCLIINPILAGEKYPFKYLAGVGVASKLGLALIKRAKLSDENKQKLEEKILDLVAIGTIADCVTLLGENRVLVKRGLEILNTTNRLGLKELIKVAKINQDKKIDSWNVGFQLSPRLNAAGRMDHANTALKLLTTKDRTEAETLSIGLNERNQDRQKITEEIVNEIVGNIEKNILQNKIIVAVSPSIFDSSITPWNEGIIGLVAGRICEKYYLPVLVITGREAEIKGSGRSIREFNLIKTIEVINQSLSKYGGHAAACGFSINGQANLQKFIEDITSSANQQLAEVQLIPSLEIDAELALNQVNEELIDTLELFSPFGENNNRPVFASSQVDVIDIQNMGIDGRHLKLKIRSKDSRLVTAIGFGQSVEWKELRIGDKIDIAYIADVNEFNGRREVQLKIIDIKTENKQIHE